VQPFRLPDYEAFAGFAGEAGFEPGSVGRYDEGVDGCLAVLFVDFQAETFREERLEHAAEFGFGDWGLALGFGREVVMI
jgi:hypothetical protein